MPDIHFECPKCTQSLDAPEELASQLIECPTCKETIEVPLRSRAAKPPASAPLPSLPIPQLSQPLRQEFINPNLETCPACRAQVSREADVCPHCGHPIKRGFLGRAGTERVLNVGCFIIILVIVALVVLGSCSGLMR
jgi:uncharacterized paraquat-inducible protein A